MDVHLYVTMQYILFLFAKEILEKNVGWRLSCQAIPNSLIRTRPVQVPGISHNMVVGLSLEGQQVIVRREHIVKQRTPNLNTFKKGTCYNKNTQITTLILTQNL